MNSIFKILSSEQWEEAKITGLIPKSSADVEHDCVHVNEFADLTAVCRRFFQPSDVPVALEFAPDPYNQDLQWSEPTQDKHWREGRLKIDHLLADLVLNIYSFEHKQTDNGIVFSLLGEQ